ncbi:glycosyltransferase family 2 protein [Acuticoccus yangtzensis]|uniref:glycosyltransferase family 2 protein n=1 Tax=Acuticoccus yangtzensis TaxID=1443441 RepID=UPI0009498BCA|nr:glycosyltransferase family 2 protein [Acuticoccus yangtzensis]
MTQISVLIPVYNAGPYLSATLDSVLAQMHKDVEIVAVDDGSTDGSDEILDRYADRITVLRNAKSSGASAARNCAFAASTGDAVLYLDADDIIAPNHLAALSEAIKHHDQEAIAFGRWARFHAHPNEAIFPNRPTERTMPGVDWLLTDWCNMQPMMQCGMFLIPRALIERAGGWDERLSLIDDFEFFSRLITTASGMVFAPEARLYYRSGNAGSLSGQKSRKAVESQHLSLMLGTDHLLTAENSPRTRGASANVLAQFDYEHYPAHADLRASVRTRVAELGGADVAPSGPPNFHRLRRLIGWRAARRVQRAMGR